MALSRRELLKRAAILIAGLPFLPLVGIRAFKQSATAAPAAPRLLFIDDEPLLLGLFERLFTRRGMDVTCFQRGDEALQHLARGATYDVAITDYIRPKGEIAGFAFIDRLRQTAPQTKVILISAVGTPERFRQARAAGAVYTLHKPFATGELVTCVQQALDSA